MGNHDRAWQGWRDAVDAEEAVLERYHWQSTEAAAARVAVDAALVAMKRAERAAR